MMPSLFLATLFGLFSKESALCIVPLVPFAALVASGVIHPDKPRPVSRAAMAALATVSAFVLYVELRRRLFPAPVAHELSDEVIATKHGLSRFYAQVLRWYAQPALPRDPLNNPLVDARDRAAHRGGSSRLRSRAGPGAPPAALVRRLLGPAGADPRHRGLSGERPRGDLVRGAAPRFGVARRRWVDTREQPAPVTLKSGAAQPLDFRPIVAVALVWIVVSYFPVSNIPIALPTVRAERFWYFPAIATSVLLALVFAKAIHWPKEMRAPRPRGGAVLLSARS